jgi:hypothetical protein
MQTKTISARRSAQLPLSCYHGMRKGNVIGAAGDLAGENKLQVMITVESSWFASVGPR